MSKGKKSKKSDIFKHVEIHQEMLGDKVRTSAYEKAIKENVKSEDVVLDLGCGTGILSFFAAKKGCKKVYAIDKNQIIDEAKKTAELNNLGKKIEFIKTDIKRFKPKEKINVLIQEQIGVALWDEDMLSKVKYVRDNFLKSNGIMIPAKIDLFFVPTNYKTNFEKSISFWNKKIYGIDFSNVGKKVFLENVGKAITSTGIKLYDTKTFLCKEKLAYTIDFRKENQVPKKIETFFKLKEKSRLTGMCGFFKVHLDEKNNFSTKPKKAKNAWGQMFFPCFEPKTIKKNCVLGFTVFPHKDPEKWKFAFEINPKKEKI